MLQHLFTCDLDGKELTNIHDCVERLKQLDEMGRVWGQNMLLEVREGNLLLTDIESKVRGLCDPESVTGCLNPQSRMLQEDDMSEPLKSAQDHDLHRIYTSDITL